MVPIPRFSAVKEEVPLYDQKRDIERIEKRNSREPAFQIGIQKHRVAAHWTVAVTSMLLRHVTSQQVRWIQIQSLQEVVLDGQ